MKLCKAAGDGKAIGRGVDGDEPILAFYRPKRGKIDQMIPAVDPKEKKVQRPGHKIGIHQKLEDRGQFLQPVRRLEMKVHIPGEVLRALVRATGQKDNMRRGTGQAVFCLQPIVPVVETDEKYIHGHNAQGLERKTNTGGGPDGPAEVVIEEHGGKLIHGMTVIVDDKAVRCRQFPLILELEKDEGTGKRG